MFVNILSLKYFFIYKQKKNAKISILAFQQTCAKQKQNILFDAICAVVCKFCANNDTKKLNVWFVPLLFVVGQSDKV